MPLDIRVATNAPTGSALFAIAADGTLVFAPATDAERAFGQPVWLDRSGRAREALRSSVRGENLIQSPDGSRLAATLVDAQNDVGVYDLRSGRLTRLTFDPGEDVYPIWKRDGRSVTYAASRDGALNLYAMAADGAGEETRLTTSPLDQAPCDWGPGDRFLLYIEEHPETRTDIWVLDVGSGAAKPLVRTRADEREARVSRDGRWLAYESNESGRPEIYVIGFPGGHGRWQVSHGGGRSPRWSPASDELFYVAEDRSLTAVEVAGGQGFEIRRETGLFGVQKTNFDYSVAADGRSFLTLSSDQGYDRLVVAVGWSAALAGRAGDR
jgi:serine/threonine-protein kinase